MPNAEYRYTKKNAFLTDKCSYHLIVYSNSSAVNVKHNYLRIKANAS